MSILGAVIVPHPPLIIPTVGRGQEQEVRATIDAYRIAAKQVAAWPWPPLKKAATAVSPWQQDAGVTTLLYPNY